MAPAPAPASTVTPRATASVRMSPYPSPSAATIIAMATLMHPSMATGAATAASSAMVTSSSGASRTTATAMMTISATIVPMVGETPAVAPFTPTPPSIIVVPNTNADIIFSAPLPLNCIFVSLSSSPIPHHHGFPCRAHSRQSRHVGGAMAYLQIVHWRKRTRRSRGTNTQPVHFVQIALIETSMSEIWILSHPAAAVGPASAGLGGCV
mmetsp:Transcript_471/g.902  ORF Transcript_471/g.902 Transcript_471/m.902 type:complete len:209 (-) Transcript_471:141-767(-)